MPTGAGDYVTKVYKTAVTADRAGEGAIQALQDAVIKLIAYDFESLDAGQRR